MYDINLVYIKPCKSCEVNVVTVCLWLYSYTCYTVCPSSLDPIYIVTYYTNWVKTSWTDSKIMDNNSWIYDRNLNVQTKMILLKMILLGLMIAGSTAAPGPKVEFLQRFRIHID